MAAKWYVGITGDKRIAFPSVVTPTAKCAPLFFAVIGPFKTKRAAFWAQKHGRNNPHCQTVRDAEFYAKLPT